MAATSWWGRGLTEAGGRIWTLIHILDQIFSSFIFPSQAFTLLGEGSDGGTGMGKHEAP